MIPNKDLHSILNPTKKSIRNHTPMKLKKIKQNQLS